MRAALIFLAACTTPAAKPPAAPIANTALHSCGDAAEGLEHATRALRDPEVSILAGMREHCVADHWPSTAIDCFTAMAPDDLPGCAGELSADQRERMFGAFDGGIVVAVARLRVLHTNIPDCDQLIGAFVTVLTCDTVPFQQRVELGNETADFWQLPDKLPPAASQRMATACSDSLVELKARVGNSGCMP